MDGEKEALGMSELRCGDGCGRRGCKGGGWKWVAFKGATGNEGAWIADGCGWRGCKGVGGNGYREREPLRMSELGRADGCGQHGCKLVGVKEAVGMSELGCAELGMSELGCADGCGRCGCKGVVARTGADGVVARDSVENCSGEGAAGSLDVRTAADGAGAREWAEMGREQGPLHMSELGCADGCGRRRQMVERRMRCGCASLDARDARTAADGVQGSGRKWVEGGLEGPSAKELAAVNRGESQAAPQRFESEISEDALGYVLSFPEFGPVVSHLSSCPSSVAMEDSVEQLRKELGEVRQEIQDLLEKQDRLQRRLEALEQKAPWSPSVPSVATPAPPSGAPVVVPVAPQAQPLSKRLDVALGAGEANGTTGTRKRQRSVEMAEGAEEPEEELPDRSLAESSCQIWLAFSKSAEYGSWRPIGVWRRLLRPRRGLLGRAALPAALLRPSQQRTRGVELLKPIQEVAFAFEQWFPSRILVLGGATAGASRSVELFDGKWQRVADMDRGRACGAAVCTSDGRVLVMGGKDGDTALDSVEEYNLDSNTWQSVSPLRIARWGCAAVEFRNQVYVIGGRNTEPVLQCESFSRSEWCMAPSLIEGRTCPTAAVLGGDLFVLGGGSSGSTVERLDFEASRWTIEPLPAQVPVRLAPTMAWSPYQGLVSIGGGTAESPTTALARSECLKLQFGQASWVQLPSWRIPRLFPAAAVSPQGDIYILGGRHNKEASVLADRWAPESHSWRVLSLDMNDARCRRWDEDVSFA
eukprot:s101_g30.t1